jgi:hypothetical protein
MLCMIIIHDVDNQVNLTGSLICRLRPMKPQSKTLIWPTSANGQI